MTTDIAAVSQRVREYVAKKSYTDMSKVKSETLLFREGIFDSMAFVLLIDFLEENFSIKIKDNDLIEENFESIAAISAFVERKKAGVLI